MCATKTKGRLSWLLPVAATLALSGCVAGGAVMQETSRSLARTAVANAANRYVPGVDVSPFTDCVINNADTSEIVTLAQAATAGAEGPARAWPVVRTIVSRPAATDCLIGSISTGQMAGLAGLFTR